MVKMVHLFMLLVSSDHYILRTRECVFQTWSIKQYKLLSFLLKNLGFLLTMPANFSTFIFYFRFEYELRLQLNAIGSRFRQIPLHNK